MRKVQKETASATEVEVATATEVAMATEVATEVALVTEVAVGRSPQPRPVGWLLGDISSVSLWSCRELRERCRLSGMEGRGVRWSPRGS